MKLFSKTDYSGEKEYLGDANRMFSIDFRRICFSCGMRKGKSRNRF